MKQVSQLSYDLRSVNSPTDRHDAAGRPLVADLITHGKAFWRKVRNALPKWQRRHVPVAPAVPSEPPVELAEPAQPVVQPPARFQDHLLHWLKRFALYLSAVIAACAIAIGFFRQIPLLQDLPQLVKNISDPQPARLAPVAPTPPAVSVPETSPPPTAPATPATPAVAQAPLASEQAPITPQPLPTETPATQVPPEQIGAITVTTTLPESTTAPAPANDPNATGQPPAAVPDQANAAAAQANPSTPASTPQPDAATAESAPAVAPQQEIQQLLVDAQQQMANRKFISPPSGNALQSYQRVLELEPTNPVATEGIQRISTYYQDIAKQSLQQGRIDEGLAYINRGLRATPKSATLLGLRREARLAKQRQEEQRQAVLLEERRQQETADLVRRRQEDLIQPTQAQQPNQTQPAQQPAQPNREIRVIPRQSLPRPPQSWGQRAPQAPSFNESGFNQR
jgi:hypothetical protein